MPHPVPIEDDEDQPRDQRWLGPGDRLAFDINLMDSAAPGRRIGDNASAVTGEAAALAARAARLAGFNSDNARLQTLASTPAPPAVDWNDPAQAEAAALAARAVRLANLNRSRGRNTSGRG